jgi:ATP-dependent DNA helicase RecQ
VSRSPLDVLQQYWGHASFRPLQEDIIQSILSGQDTLALLPTGGGKSVCFQVPGLLLGGLTLVISPLIALMKDQVERLEQMGIAATFINSSLGQGEIDWRLQRAMEGKYAFLYLAPERIRSEMFLARLPRMNVSLLAVDEAHCISQWGYDFRPAYLEISQLRESCPQIPVLALTASATPQVQEDICARLALRSPTRFASSFLRPNLRYFVLEEENAQDRIVDIIRRKPGSGIVYARTRRLAEQISRLLSEAGISAAAYHGGLKTSERSRVQQAWIENRCRVIAATNAFGMGIDKPDVRFVLHYNLPFDLESYYQEAGRGGRDGQEALAVAFHSHADLAELRRWSELRYPQWEQFLAHYQALCNFYQVPSSGPPGDWQPFRIAELAAASGFSAMELYASLRILQNEGWLYLQDEEDDYATVHICVPPQEVLNFKSAHPALAGLTDFLLRQVGGAVYSHPIRFLPSYWAERQKISPEALDSALQRMAAYGLLRYVPALREPQLRFLKPRSLPRRRELNWEKYEFLRKQSERRLAEMIRYTTQNRHCRSRLIQEYFGEKDAQDCGHCDVCMGWHRTEISEAEFARIREALRTRLAQGPLPYRELLREVRAGAPAQREEVLRFLMDKQVVLASPQGLLRWAGEALP